jgi:hypothetical protein
MLNMIKRQYIWLAEWLKWFWSIANFFHKKASGVTQAPGSVTPAPATRHQVRIPPNMLCTAIYLASRIARFCKQFTLNVTKFDHFFPKTFLSGHFVNNLDWNS